MRSASSSRLQPWRRANSTSSRTRTCSSPCSGVPTTVAPRSRLTSSSPSPEVAGGREERCFGSRSARTRGRARTGAVRPGRPLHSRSRGGSRPQPRSSPDREGVPRVGLRASGVRSIELEATSLLLLGQEVRDPAERQVVPGGTKDVEHHGSQGARVPRLEEPRHPIEGCAARPQLIDWSARGMRWSGARPFP